MSGNDERTEILRRLERDERRAREEAETRRRRRNCYMKKRSMRSILFVGTTLLLITGGLWLTSSGSFEKRVITVSADGNYTRIDVSYESNGDSTTKHLVGVVIPNNTIVSETNPFNYNWDKSMEFLITPYIDGIGQKTVSFVLVTSGNITIDCDGILIHMGFDAYDVISKPYFMEISIVIVVVGAFIILIFFVSYLWVEIGYRYRCWRI